MHFHLDPTPGLNTDDGRYEDNETYIDAGDTEVLSEAEATSGGWAARDHQA